MKYKEWVLAAKFEGEPSPSNFVLHEEPIKTGLKDGEVMCEAVYLSVDPYTWFFAGEVGDVLRGEQVARVIMSKHPYFNVGCLVLGHFGWRSITKVSDPSMMRPIPHLGDLPLSLTLGILGTPGLTAYFGVLDVLKVKMGDTFVVTAAASTTGSFAGQIAKMKGCKVIGFVGSREKCDLIKGYGFDYVFNYKEVTLEDALWEAAPEGVDCYYDNSSCFKKLETHLELCKMQRLQELGRYFPVTKMGGEFTNSILSFMKKMGRIAVCSSSSIYEIDENQTIGPLPYLTILKKTLTVQAFLVSQYSAEWPTALSEMVQWVKEGKIKYKETITNGFDSMVDTLIGLFKGRNIGMTVVKY